MGPFGYSSVFCWSIPMKDFKVCGSEKPGSLITNLKIIITSLPPLPVSSPHRRFGEQALRCSWTILDGPLTPHHRSRISELPQCPDTSHASYPSPQGPDHDAALLPGGEGESACRCQGTSMMKHWGFTRKMAPRYLFESEYSHLLFSRHFRHRERGRLDTAPILHWSVMWAGWWTPENIAPAPPPSGETWTCRNI